MKGQVGVWIDYERAVIVAWEGHEPRMKTIESSIDGKVRFEGETDQAGRFGGQFVTNERSLEKRRKQQITLFAKQVVAHLSTADEIVIFGPAEMKTALKKMIDEQPILAPRLKGVETADSMTDNQIVAWVKDYYE